MIYLKTWNWAISASYKEATKTLNSMQTGLIIECVSPYWVLNNQNIRRRDFMALKIVWPSRHREQDQSEWKIFHSAFNTRHLILLLWSSLLTHCMMFNKICFMARVQYDHLHVSLNPGITWVWLYLSNLLTPHILFLGTGDTNLSWIFFWN